MKTKIKTTVEYTACVKFSFPGNDRIEEYIKTRSIHSKVRIAIHKQSVVKLCGCGHHNGKLLPSATFKSYDLEALQIMVEQFEAYVLLYKNAKIH